MASGFACGCERMTTVELRKIAAVLQLTALETCSLAWFMTYFFDIFLKEI